MKRFRRSILMQLMLLVQSSVLVAVLLIAGLAYWELDAAGKTLMTSQMMSLNYTLSSVASGDLDRGDQEAPNFQRTAADLLKGANGQITRVFLEDMNGKVTVTTDPSLAGKALTDGVPQNVLAQQGNQKSYLSLQGPEYDAALPLMVQGKPWGVIRMQGPTKVLRDMQWMAAMPLLIGLVVIVILSGLITRGRAKRLTRPLRELSAKTEQLAAGDLTVRLAVKGEDEVAQLAHDFNVMTDRMRGLLLEIQTAGDQVVDSSRQLSSASTEAAQSVEHLSSLGASVSERAGQQAEDATGAAAVMNELSEAVDQIARGAVEQAAGMTGANDLTTQMAAVVQRIGQEIEEVSAAAQAALRAASNGQEAVTASTAGMERIRQAVNVAAQQMERLTTSSARINEVIALIGEVAEQTNLLALNAAIEAARAGDSGRGFAVVADEVRRLAARTQGAAGEVTNLVQAIQVGTAEVLAAVERGATEAHGGSELALRAAGSLGEIVQSVQETERRASTILKDATGLVQSSSQMQASIAEAAAVAEENSAAAEEMSAGSAQVLHLIRHVEGVSRESAGVMRSIAQDTHQLSATSEEIAASAETLQQAAQRLQEAARRFKA